MFANRTIVKFFGTTAAAAGIGVAALATAGTAGAGMLDDVFLDTISDYGIDPPSATEAIETANEVCEGFDGGVSLVGAADAVADYTGLSTKSSAFFVGAAIATYCPRHLDQLDA